MHYVETDFQEVLALVCDGNSLWDAGEVNGTLKVHPHIPEYWMYGGRVVVTFTF